MDDRAVQEGHIYRLGPAWVWRGVAVDSVKGIAGNLI